MPLYTFINGKGETREELVSHNTKSIQVDGKSWDRVAVEHVGVVGVAREPDDQKTQIRKGYYEAECRGGSRFKSSYSKKQIKKIWGI
jgi:hypothetical protein